METIRLLHVYFTGILIIDEIQVRNIIESAQSKVMQLFLLSIINAGIPVILMGNPLGFKWINKFSQDVRRLYSIAPVILDPYPSPLGDDEWKTIYRGIKSYYVLEKYPKNDDKMCHLLWAVSGGIPGIAMTIWRAAQRIRLFDSEGGELQEQDLSDAFNLEGFDELRMIANGFSTQNPIILKHFSDIPWREYGKKWGKSDGYDEITSDESEIYIEKMSTKRKRISERSKLKAKNTREKNKQKKRDQVKTQLTNDDLRNQSSGLQAVLLDGLMDTIDIDEKA